MSIGQMFSVLRARWRLALIVLLLTIGTTTTLSVILPKTYSAGASIVVDAKPDLVSGIIFPGLGTPAFMATQVDILLSDRVWNRVIRNLKLAENPKVRDLWSRVTVRDLWSRAINGEATIEGWLHETLKRSLSVKPSIESNVIMVDFSAHDPQLAADLANGVVNAYLEIALELRVDPARQSSRFLDVRAKEARAALEGAQSRLSAYQREKGVVITEERLDVEVARLNELSTQLVMLQALASESGSRQVQAQGGSSDRLAEVLNSPLIGGLKADLSRSEARLQELGARLGDNHPQVIEAKANVNALRGRVEAETRRVTGGVGVTAAINRQREAELRASLEAQRAKVQRMKVVRDEGGVLMRDVEGAQRAYEAVVQRLNQSSLESQVTQSSMYVLTDAWVPVKPSSPKVALNVALSIVIGSLLALGAVLLLESTDRRFRAREDATASIGLPLLGVLPGPDNGPLLGKTARPLLARRVLGQLPVPHSHQ